MKSIKPISVLFICILFSSSILASLRIGSFNIRNFDAKGESTDKKELKKILLASNADILGTQEIVNSKNFKNFLTAELPEYGVALSRCGGGGRQKLGIVYRKTSYELTKIYEDSRFSDPGSVVSQIGCGSLRPALVAIMKDLATKREFVVINLHLKAGSGTKNYKRRWMQYELINKLVKELRLAEYEDIILVGDMNTTGFTPRDTDYIKFKDTLNQIGYFTVSDELSCTSYWRGRNRNDQIEEASILDHILHNSNFLGYQNSKVSVHSHCAKAKCTNVSSQELGISYKRVSDHCPIITEFSN